MKREEMDPSITPTLFSSKFDTLLCFFFFFGWTKVLTTSSGKGLISLSLSLPLPAHPLSLLFFYFHSSFPRCYTSLHIFPTDDLSFLFFTSSSPSPKCKFFYLPPCALLWAPHLLVKLQVFLVHGQCLTRKKSDTHFTGYCFVEEERLGSLDSLLHFIVLPLTGKLVFLARQLTHLLHSHILLSYTALHTLNLSQSTQGIIYQEYCGRFCRFWIQHLPNAWSFFKRRKDLIFWVCRSCNCLPALCLGIYKTGGELGIESQGPAWRGSGTMRDGSQKKSKVCVS